MNSKLEQIGLLLGRSTRIAHFSFCLQSKIVQYSIGHVYALPQFASSEFEALCPVFSNMGFFTHVNDFGPRNIFMLTARDCTKEERPTIGARLYQTTSVLAPRAVL